MSPASPQEVVSARRVDRVAWVDYAEGKRNAYTAVAPKFAPVRVTNFLKDDGIMMSGIRKLPPISMSWPRETIASLPLQRARRATTVAAALLLTTYCQLVH